MTVLSATDSTPAAANAFLQGYQPPGNAFDELLAPAGSPRAHWQVLAQSLSDLGLETFRHRWQEAQHLIHENGVTYNVYGDPGGLDRPWQLDPIPLIISAQEGDALEAGLIQRARLLEAILADLYGPQTLLQSGLVPPELVFACPSFLRPCHGLKLPGDRYLHLIAVDLGRGPDGSIHVLGDRTQAPSGAGYALENRLVLSRMLPEVFEECRVQRLALFFRTLRDTLRSLATHNRDNPRIVLLTPGPHSETYFEHAYLARYLGYTLVEGADLTVRDNRVFLRLLDGLQPVDVILRRLDDDFCDPLELRGDSLLGVPGLVQAVRAGNVAVANCLGSGLVESPGLLPYLPTLCRQLLSEDLLIPSARAWWCGEPKSLAYVLAHLDHMVVKPAFRAVRMAPIFTDRLTTDQRQDLAQRITRRPQAYVGQEPLELSACPTLGRHGLQPRRVVVRAYLAAAGQQAFTLMPGGLTRLTVDDHSLLATTPRGGGSKDTWVLTTGPVSTFSLLRPTVQPVELSRGGGDLPSRSADNLFWLGRYVERTEGLVRLLRGIVIRLTEKPGLAEVPELPILLRALTHLTQTLPGFVGDGAEVRLADPQDELFSLVYETTRVGSLAYNLGCLFRVAGSVRDRISLDMWRVLSRLDVRQPEPSSYGGAGPASRFVSFNTLSDLLEVLDQMVLTLAAFGGLAMESVTRGHGWRFLDMGRRIERSVHMMEVVRHTLVTVTPNEGPLLEALLEIADSSMTYRRRYLSSLQIGPALDLLLADESNPRSLAFQMLHLRDDVDHLPNLETHFGRTSEQRLALSLLTMLQLAEMDNLAQASSRGTRPHLEELLTKLESDLPLLSDAITLHFLSHLQPSRHLAGG